MNDSFLILLIEDLRIRRNITQEDFTYGIIESKQYRKYLDGISKVPFKILIELTNRLGIKFEDLMNYFYHYNFEETKNMITLVEYISVYDFSAAKKAIDNIELSPLIQTENKLMFNISKLMYQYYSGELPRKTWVTKLLSMIDYDELLKNDALSIAEMYALTELMDATDNLQKAAAIANKLNSLILNQEYNNINIPNFIIMRLIKYFHVLEDDKKIYVLCKQGITNCVLKKSFYLLDYFYYCLSVCENKFGNIKNRNDAILKCYSSIMINYSDSEYDKFSNLFLKDYGKSLKQLISEIISDKE